MQKRRRREPTVALFGAPLDSGNRGVEALGRSVVGAVLAHEPDAAVTVFDNGLGVRRADLGPAGSRTVELCGVRRSRRLHRAESWTRVGVSQRLHLPNLVADRLRAADVVLDISGGDSFSDIYGSRRLRTTLLPKRAALRAGRPLVLLPQTYGPFGDPLARRAAAEVVRRASLAWARDGDSFDVLLDLLGADADPVRHRRGVDVAFALHAADPGRRLPPAVRSFFEGADAPVAGVNVSGLLANDPSSSARFGLALDYRETLLRTVTALATIGARVLLVPHVREGSGGGESDAAASAALVEALPRHLVESVVAVPDALDAAEAKWVIARCDWFTGARMHATIAALSSGVPATALSYSMKFRGVFATCDCDDQVVDARMVGTDEAVAQLVTGWHDRTSTRSRLAVTIPDVVTAAEHQVLESLNVAERPIAAGAA